MILKKNINSLDRRHELIIVVIVIMIACSFIIFKASQELTKPENLLKKTTKLQAGSLVNYLNIPDDYYFEWHDANTMTIHIEYPAMLPNYPKTSFSMDKTIRIYIATEGLSGTDEVKTFLKHVHGGWCSSNQSFCYARRISSNKEYDYFKEGTEDYYANKHGKASKYYLFKAYDSQKILLEDSGEWSHSYTIKRNIENYFLLEYQVPKQLLNNTEITKKIESDFKIIDKNVTEFVKSHINYQKPRNENKIVS